MRASDETTAQNLRTSEAVIPDRSALRTGDRVRARGYHWRIVSVRTFANCELVDLAGVETENAGTRARLLTPFDRLRPLDGSSQLTRVRPARARLGLAALAGAGSLRAAPYARIDVLPHQIDPALTLLRGDATRLLLADEVGLGKTIQAAIAIAELRARGRAHRILILTPAGLREQWIAELAARFRLEAALVDAAALRERMASIPRAVNPWLTWPVVVASIDFVKRPDVLTPVAEADWDILVVDEAHTVASAPDRHSAVDRLAARTPYVLLLTATPHNGDDQAYRALCALGGSRAHDDIVVFRRTRRHAGLTIRRRVHLLSIALTAAERQMHRTLTMYVERVIADAHCRGDADAVLAMIVLTKRALSGAASLERSVDRRIALLSGRADAHGFQMTLPLATGSDSDLDRADGEPDVVLASAGLDDAFEESRWLERLRALAVEAAHADSKIRVVRTLLRRTREPVIVFTEYRDTLRTLEGALAEYAPLAVHGGVDARERAALTTAFCRGAHRLLLATDVASEGLNLQASCRIVVSLELPWTPARLEQRIGRVDRIGQRRGVHAFNLLARGTAETEVLARLLRKLAAMRRSLGEVDTPLGHVRDEASLRAAIANEPVAVIAGRRVTTTKRMAQRATLARDEAARIVRWQMLWKRIAAGRVIAATDVIAALEESAPWIAIERRPAVLQPGILALFRSRVSLGAGRAFEDLLVALHLPAADRVRKIPPRAARELARSMIPALTERALRETHKRSRDVLRQQRAWRERRDARGAAIAAAVVDGEERQGVLFQRRALPTRGEERTAGSAPDEAIPDSPELLVLLVLATR